jgi:hypothetical protein
MHERCGLTATSRSRIADAITRFAGFHAVQWYQ